MDLVSLDIQRGRDHGLPTYGQMRQALSMTELPDFSTFTATQGQKQKLDEFYTHPNNLDLFLGILGEPDVANSALGEVGTQVVQ